MPEQRGRKPRGAYKQKTKVFSTRIRADTKEALAAAAKQRGHSLSQEIEYRLRRSFDEDEKMLDKFGGRRNYAVLRLISCLMEAVYNPLSPGAFWLDDPYLFNQFVKTTINVLEELRPPGDTSLPSDGSPQGDLLRLAGELQGGSIAANRLLSIKDAAPDLPLDINNPAPFIRADLGPAADRIGAHKDRRITSGTSEDFRRAAEEMAAEKAKEEGDQ
jgi:hypothetical protein